MSLFYRKINFPKEQGAQKPRRQLILIHGWAMNSAIWESLLPKIDTGLPIISVDLPGYGQSTMIEPYNLKGLAETLSPLLDKAEKSIILGWSLGGLVAMELAQQMANNGANDKLERLILVGSSPCFVEADNWPYAVEKDIFLQFAQSLKNNVESTIKRFMALQLLGVDNAKVLARSISSALLQQGSPNPQALEAGLDILLAEDKREVFHQIDKPIHLLCGNKDTLVKIPALEQLMAEYAEENSNSPLRSLDIITGAGHVAFVSHLNDFYPKLLERLGPNT